MEERIGFEPTAPSMRTKCSARLSYTPAGSTEHSPAPCHDPNHWAVDRLLPRRARTCTLGVRHGSRPTVTLDLALTDTDVDQLFRDALAIRSLLTSLDADDHHLRAELLLARDDVRARAAAAWRQRGWRSITDDR